MENNKLYNNIINGISNSLKDVLDETIGTLQLNKTESILIDTIFNDLDNQIYLSNKVSYNDYKDIPQLSSTDILFKIYSLYNKISFLLQKFILIIKFLSKVYIFENNSDK